MHVLFEVHKLYAVTIRTAAVLPDWYAKSTAPKSACAHFVLSAGNARQISAAGSRMSSKSLALQPRKASKVSLHAKHSGIYSTHAQSLPLPPGFHNKWNSCYANSILHCCFNILPLRQLCTCLHTVHPEECNCKSQGIDLL